jgi:hypothetical protein
MTNSTYYVSPHYALFSGLPLFPAIHVLSALFSSILTGSKPLRDDTLPAGQQHLTKGHANHH